MKKYLLGFVLLVSAPVFADSYLSAGALYGAAAANTCIYGYTGKPEYEVTARKLRNIAAMKVLLNKEQEDDLIEAVTGVNPKDRFKESNNE